MIIDAHQHFWKLSRGDYTWLTAELEPLYRDFLPKHLIGHLKKKSIDGTIVVQAAPTTAETEFLLSLANKNNQIMGVVGWVDFESSDVQNLIKQMSTNEKLIGLRPMIQDIQETDWMLKDNVKPAFMAMTEHKLTFDALTLPKHLDNLLSLLTQFPELTTVIDHASKPDIKNQKIYDWEKKMRKLASETSAYCKLSGLVTEASSDWSIDELKPYVDILLDSFGPSRLIWGSDWPVLLLASNYDDWFEASLKLLPISKEEQALIFGGNAIRAYGL